MTVDGHHVVICYMINTMHQMPNVLSPRDLVFRPDNKDETLPH